MGPRVDEGRGGGGGAARWGAGLPWELSVEVGSQASTPPVSGSCQTRAHTKPSSPFFCVLVAPSRGTESMLSTSSANRRRVVVPRYAWLVITRPSLSLSLSFVSLVFSLVRSPFLSAVSSALVSSVHTEGLRDLDQLLGAK